MTGQCYGTESVDPLRHPRNSEKTSQPHSDLVDSYFVCDYCSQNDLQQTGSREVIQIPGDDMKAERRAEHSSVFAHRLCMCSCGALEQGTPNSAASGSQKQVGMCEAPRLMEDQRWERDLH